MKKFQFGLDTVLDYKTQILESLQAEHGAILAQVRKQEEVLRRLEHRYGQTNEAFCEKKKTGLSVADALAFETGLRALEKDIHREGEKLAQLRRREAAKRAEVVQAKQDTSSLEKLKDKKWEAYRKEEQKAEERFIDELVSTNRAVARM